MNARSNLVANQRGASRRFNAREKIGPTVVSRHLSENTEAAQKFAAVILKIPTHRIATAARSSKDAVLMWKSARRCPSWPKVMAMAQTIPQVRAFVREQTEPSANSERIYQDTVTMLLALAAVPGKAGDDARRALHAMQGGAGG